MWVCAFPPPVQLYFILRNTECTQDFTLSHIKIWNYNRSLNVSVCVCVCVCVCVSGYLNVEQQEISSRDYKGFMCPPCSSHPRSFPLSLTHTHTHRHTHARARTHTG